MKITNLSNYNAEEWIWLKNKLDSITYNRFSDFYDNHIKENDCLMEEFATLLKDNFDLLEANWEYINNKDFSMIFGGFTNGEISVKNGISQMISPELHGGNAMATVAVSDGMKSFLKKWGLFSRAINRNPCCKPSCRCGVSCEDFERRALNGMSV